MSADQVAHVVVLVCAGAIGIIGSVMLILLAFLGLQAVWRLLTIGMSQSWNALLVQSAQGRMEA